MSAKKQQLGILARSAEFDRAGLDEEKRTVNLSFSSEALVERDFGIEILDHGTESVRMDRLNGGAPLLWNHNRDEMIGVVDSASIEARKGQAVVRFGNSQRAQEVFNDVKDGVVRSVSVGYRIHNMVVNERQGDVETLRATDWEPMEISLVSVPADVSVGVGRDADQVETTIERHEEPTKTERIIEMDEKKTDTPNVEVLVENARQDATKAEAKRQSEIRAIAQQSTEFVADAAERAEKAINEGMGIDTFQREMFNALKVPAPKKAPVIELSEKEQRQYSIVRAINLNSKGQLDGLEKEVHEEALKQQGGQRQDERSVLIPYNLLGAAITGKRDQLVGTASLGGNLKATNLLASDFIDVLRNRLVVARMGGRILSGLVGDVAIPRKLTSATANWVTEAEAATESNVTFDQVSLTPKGVHAMTDLSVKLLKQSTPSIDALVADDITNVIAVAIDLAALHGSGSAGQPTGIAGTSGIGSVAGGTNGAAPDFQDMVDLEKEVAIDNADMGNLGYVTNAKVRAALKTTPKQASGVEGNFVWQDALVPGTPGEGTVNGYRGLVSNQVADNLTKGTSTTVCSAVFYGNWQDLLIGQWGSLELLTDPYTQAANRVVRVHAYQYVDVAVRHAQSFSAMLDAIA